VVFAGLEWRTNYSGADRRGCKRQDARRGVGVGTLQHAAQMYQYGRPDPDLMSIQGLASFFPFDFFLIFSVQMLSFLNLSSPSVKPINHLTASNALFWQSDAA
jgi:hypothetical protein